MNSADWTAVAAIATAVMAIATFWMASKTRALGNQTAKMAEETGKLVTETAKVAGATTSVVEATLKEAKAVEAQVEQLERQVELSARTLTVGIQPWLVWEPTFQVQDPWDALTGRHGRMYPAGTHVCFDVSVEETSVKGWFTVRNVGPGIAVLDMSNSLIFPRNGLHAFENLHPTFESPVLPPGGTVDIEFTISASHAADQKKMTLLEVIAGGPNFLSIQVAYGDVLGTLPSSALFRAYRRDEQHPWSVIQIDYHLGDRVVVARRFAT